MRPIRPRRRRPRERCPPGPRPGTGLRQSERERSSGLLHQHRVDVGVGDPGVAQQRHEVPQQMVIGLWAPTPAPANSRRFPSRGSSVQHDPRRRVARPIGLAAQRREPPTRSSSSRVGGPDTHDHHIVMVMPGCQTRSTSRTGQAPTGNRRGRRAWSPIAIRTHRPRLCFGAGAGANRSDVQARLAHLTGGGVRRPRDDGVGAGPAGNSDLKAERAAWRNGAPRVGENANGVVGDADALQPAVAA